MRLKNKKTAAPASDKLNVDPDHAQSFDDLAKDVLGDDGSDSGNEFDNKKKNWNEDEDEEDKEPSYMVCIKHCIANLNCLVTQVRMICYHSFLIFAKE